MVSRLIFFLLFTAFSKSSKAQNAPNVGTLTVNVNNIQHREGNIKAILQNQSNFLTPQYVACIEVIPTKNEAQMVFKNLPIGDYSVAIYHDLNANNVFDRNWIGYPKEPFAVSNNLQPYKLLLPSFNAAKVCVLDKNIVVDIHLLNN
jgi:uncharacterized protein (DUF2141 family)